MKKNILFLVFAIFLAGCTKQKIKLEKKFQTLEHINKYTATFAQEQHNILLAVKLFSSEECGTIFGTNVVRWGFQPIQITVRNFSPSMVYLCPANIGLSLVSPKKVAKRSHWKTKEIGGSFGILSAIFFWPALIPTAYSSYLMQQRNVKISKGIIQQDILHSWDTIKIHPSETVSKIVFVEKELVPEQFLITIFSKEQKDLLEFKITL